LPSQRVNASLPGRRLGVSRIRRPAAPNDPRPVFLIGPQRWALGHYSPVQSVSDAGRPSYLGMSETLAEDATDRGWSRSKERSTTQLIGGWITRLAAASRAIGCGLVTVPAQSAGREL
jgi:hypothetical protein